MFLHNVKATAAYFQSTWAGTGGREAWGAAQNVTAPRDGRRRAH